MQEMTLHPLPRQTALPRQHAPASSVRNDAEIYDDGCLRVEHNNYFVTCKGTLVAFTKTEFLLVSRMTRNINRVVLTQKLWDHAWDADKPLNLQCLHVFLYRVRRKLAPLGLRVENMVNIGYSLAHGQCCGEGGGHDASQTPDEEHAGTMATFKGDRP